MNYDNMYFIYMLIDNWYVFFDQGIRDSLDAVELKKKKKEMFYSISFLVKAKN